MNSVINLLSKISSRFTNWFELNSCVLKLNIETAMIYETEVLRAVAIRLEKPVTNRPCYGTAL
jgi:hypothetical protein